MAELNSKAKDDGEEDSTSSHSQSPASRDSLESSAFDTSRDSLRSTDSLGSSACSSTSSSDSEPENWRDGEVGPASGEFGAMAILGSFTPEVKFELPAGCPVRRGHRLIPCHPLRRCALHPAGSFAGRRPRWSRSRAITAGRLIRFRRGTGARIAGKR